MAIQAHSGLIHTPSPAMAHLESSHLVNSKIAQIMAVIRSYMPITTLFTPKLKINLREFIEDQMLIQKIAAFLVSQTFDSPINPELVAQRFAHADCLTEIKVPAAYLTFLYEACADVLNKKTNSNDLKPAIEGRIFTLKLALIAQANPLIITAGQNQHQIKSHTDAQIKEEGAGFIRHCLRLHLNALQEASHFSFKEQLTATASQLAPFVQEVTKRYLIENGGNSLDNPLTFRNPTGYNCHGLVAASIMRTCLSVLGYQTQLLGRGDLEPRVTLATKQNVIEVTAPDQSKYLVDPNYIQFHKDICLDDSQLPTAPVLVLAENEVDQYVENLMAIWKRNDKMVESGDSAAIDKLRKQNQLIPFTIHHMKLPPLLKPSNREEWVRESLKRVWELRSFRPILSNIEFREIFSDESTATKTYEYVKAMEIGPLSGQLPFHKVEARLKILQTTIESKNSLEAVALIAQLPDDHRKCYASLLDADPRVTDLSIALNTYFRSLKKLVNPNGLDKHVIYGCSGADCTSVMLATNAKFFTFVDITPLVFTEFQRALKRLKYADSLNMFSIKQELQESHMFILNRSESGGATSYTHEDGSHYMEKLPLKLFYDLQSVGVDLKQVRLKSNQDKSTLFIEFPWQYYGESSVRDRTITLIHADLTKPELYPPLLKTKIESGFDLFYMKAPFLVPQSYPQFLPQLAKFMNDCGWLMTVDKTFTMHEFNPEECLRQHHLVFEKRTSEEIKALEQAVDRPFDPFEIIPLLEMHRGERRANRSIGSDASYWSSLNLRQKS